MRQTVVDPKFTDEVNFYTVLILELDNFKPSNRTLPERFAIVGGEYRSSIRQQEKKILQMLFDDWYIPYNDNFTGWRHDSPLYALDGKKLVGGVYLCDRNVFNDQVDAGQLNYAFMHPDYKGMGIYSVLFREAMQKARTWNLKSIYLNSDRFMLPDVYIRWGAQVWKTIPKPSRLPPNGMGRLLWPIKLSFRSFLRKIRSI